MFEIVEFIFENTF